MQVARLGKSYFGAPVDDDVHAALVDAGLVQDMPPPAPHDIGYMGANTPEQPRIAYDGAPLNFLRGDPVDYQRPAINSALNEAASTEGQRYRNHLAIADADVMHTPVGTVPRYAEMTGLYGQSVPGSRGVVEPRVFDGRNALLNRGMNADRNSFVQASDDQAQAQERAAANGTPPTDELGNPLFPPPYTGADAFVQKTKEQQQALDEAPGKLIDNLLAFRSPLGPVLAAASANRNALSAYSAYDKGDTGGAVQGVANALLDASMVRPGLRASGPVDTSLQPKLDAMGTQVYRPLAPSENGLLTPGARVQMNPDGTPVTRMAPNSDPTNPWNYPRESPQWEAPVSHVPGTKINSLVGYTPAYQKQIRRKIGDAIEDHLAESSHIEATMDGAEREAALRAADAKFNEIAYGTRTPRQPMQGPPAPESAAPTPPPQAQPTNALAQPQENPFPRGRPPKRRLTPDGPVEAPGATRGMTAKESAAFRRRYWRNQDSNAD